MIHEKFTATGAGAQEESLDRFAVSVSGTFSGTVALQRKVAGAWHTIESFTEATEKVAENGGVLPTRFNCTAYTSGTIVCKTATSLPK